MQIDLGGQVAAIKLAASNALLPLFEAVVNAVEAVQEGGHANGLVEITITRSSLFGAGSADDRQQLSDIADFEVADNGVGFNERHFTSFDTSFSTLKARLGGKGVGRLLWLKAFDLATVDSVYEDQGAWYHRKFKFVRSKRGVEEMTVEPVAAPAEAPSTVVRLHSFHPMYREAAPKGAETIALRIVEHCLVMYMLDNMPRMVLRDPANGLTIDLGNLYTQELKQSTAARSFVVGEHTFEITDVLLRASADAENAIHFCANRRAVESRKLSGAVAHAENLIQSDGITLHYAACVTGDLLDSAINNERTGFVLDRAQMLALGESDVKWTEIEEAAIRMAAEFITPRLQEAKAKSVKRVEQFIEAEEPRYRILLAHRRDEVERLSGNLSDEKLESELHRIHAAWRHEAKADAASRLKSIPEDAAGFASYKADIRRALGELAEVVKADLAEYVLHRRTVLDFFSKVLGVMKDGAFAREDVLHGLIFPLRTDSNEVEYEDHNLWLLDERLAFHHYLASDIPFKLQKRSAVSVESDNRPDLLIFNRRMSFVEDESQPFGSIVIVEFKRPERNDYTDDHNPVQQVYEYIRNLRDGTARLASGATISAVPTGTRLYCQIVATVTPGLRRVLENLSFSQSPDGQGYYLHNANLNAVVEIADYQKVLSDALRRNKAFFQQLGLSTGLTRAAP